MKRNILKLVLLVSVVGLIIAGCGSTKTAVVIPDNEKEIFNQKGQDTVSIASEETEYEIIIIESGYNGWLVSFARPRNYYTQSFMENRNRLYVLEWNQRVLDPLRYGSNYDLRIDYDSRIDYGYEVNYKLYNYFIYFQRKYNQRLGPFSPRI